MARFVFVHGAFSGAWAWEGTAAELAGAGHRAVAIDLPGGGADQTPVAGVTLDAYAERICEALAADPEPAILVGHSMGGVAITQAAARCPERIALLVFVCAFMPGDGQSLIDLTKLPEGAGDQVQANITVAGDPPVATMAPEGMRAATMMCCTDEQIEWAVARRRPQPAAPMGTPVRIPAGALDGLRRAYVVCLQDRAIALPLQRRMIAEHPCVDVVEIDTDHSPYLSAPAELIAALERFAALA
jgi:pimeloyl-ACP methyl ester carboxylesterase